MNSPQSASHHEGLDIGRRVRHQAKAAHSERAEAARGFRQQTYDSASGFLLHSFWFLFSKLMENSWPHSFLELLKKHSVVARFDFPLLGSQLIPNPLFLSGFCFLRIHSMATEARLFLD